MLLPLWANFRHIAHQSELISVNLIVPLPEVISEKAKKPAALEIFGVFLLRK